MLALPRYDFFISYAQQDRDWAEWIAWSLEQNGYSIVMQAWAFLPGHSIGISMDRASASAQRTLAVISPAYFESKATAAEWAGAFQEDFDGRYRRLIPVRVRKCRLDGLRQTIVYLDLVGLDEYHASTSLLAGLPLPSHQDYQNDDGRERIKPSARSPFPGRQERTGVAWDLVLAGVSDDLLVKGVLSVCAHFAPEPIPHELFAGLAGEPAANRSSSRFFLGDDVMQHLASRGLVRSSRAGGVEMDPRAQAAVRQGEDVGARAVSVSRALQAVLLAFPGDSLDPGNWSTCELLMPHALAVLEHAFELSLTVGERTALLEQSARYSHARANYRRAKHLGEQAVDLRERELGVDHILLVGPLTALGDTLKRLGDLCGTKATYGRALCICERIYGRRHPSTAKALTCWGSSFHELRDFRSARLAHMRALQIYGTACESSQSDVARVLCNLGNALRKSGDLTTARLAHERALRIYEATHGEDQLAVAETLNNLGNILCAVWRPRGCASDSRAGTANLRSNARRKSSRRCKVA